SRLSDLDMNEWKKLSVGKSLYHQETANIFSMNTKYVTHDGFHEVVYDSNGDIVNHELDMGTYNFFDPVNDAGKHYDYDVRPYYEWGNGSDYNSTLVDKFIPF
ncbi:hypothetical protein MK079_05510, partial [Candidatus Gracilibacteria bacterium]|nr:hypothetical protein [Candidatus Gracilibacteria bacterium]